MMLPALLIGIAFPSLAGWLILDLLQGKTRVLFRGEQWVLGFALGLTFAMFCAFVLNVTAGVPFSLTGFLGVFGGLIMLFGVLHVLQKARGGRTVYAAPAQDTMTLSRPVAIGLAAIAGWVLLRAVIFGGLPLLTPSFFDDSMDNWNLRGKVFYQEQTLTLRFPWDQNARGVNSYPPTVPLAKTWLSTINGTWSDRLANMIHPAWFVALLLLLYGSLRRSLPRVWATGGAVMLASLPLELIQGTNAYGDVFLSLHLFAAALPLLHALRSPDRERVLSWLRIGLFAMALLPFTKNEGWALYFPVLAFLYAATCVQLLRRRVMTVRSLAPALLTGIVMIGLVAGFWIGFKMLNGLSFGNAKGIDLHFRWQPNVLTAVFVNTFLEGNWGLLFPLFFGLLGFRWRTALRTPLLVLTAFFLIPYGGQMFAYLFTGLSEEALFQTGYARGLIHLMPVIVFMTVMLMREALYEKGTKATKGTDGTEE